MILFVASLSLLAAVIVLFVFAIGAIPTAKAPAGIVGTAVLMDWGPAYGTYHTGRMLYNWHSGYGKTNANYAGSSGVENAIGFSLPGTTCDVELTVCDSVTTAYQKIFIDPGAANEKIGRGCPYTPNTWGCFSERFTGVSGGVHKFTIGTGANLYYAGDKDWTAYTTDLNGCIIYGVAGHTTYENNNPAANYLPTSHVRYYGYANSYLPLLNYASVSYSCA